MRRLKDASLFRSLGFIGGAWVGAESGGTFEVHNPATGELLGAVPKMGAADARRAVAAADEALPAWRGRPARERAQILRGLFELMLDHQDDLAVLMTSEQGKPFTEAKSEVAYAASFVEWFAEEGKRAYGETVPFLDRDRRLLVLKEPVGVCAAITPWNFPAAMITRKVAPALAAGCTIVVKPAELTPYTALALGVLAERAGIPPGVLNIVVGSPQEIGGELVRSPVVRKLSFTGSTAVGKLLMAQCASTVKRISLELGGNAPFIVFDDAELEAAVEGALASKYRNTGQTCVCANRLLVQESVYERFAERLAERVEGLKVGDGFEEGVQQGPLINAAAVQKVEAHVFDALEKGARLLTGGRRHALGGNFFQPTVLADVSPRMQVAREETFGPVAPLFKFKTEQEAVRMANDTEYGLAAYFYSRDVGRIFRVAEALEYGMLGINTAAISNSVAPFGGMKQSGLGREGSRYGLEEYLEIKYLCLGGVER